MLMVVVYSYLLAVGKLYWELRLILSLDMLVDFDLSFFSLLLFRSVGRSFDDFSDDDDDDDLLLWLPLFTLVMAVAVIVLLLLLLTFVSGDCFGFDIFWSGGPNNDSNLLAIWGFGSSLTFCFLLLTLLLADWERFLLVTSSTGWPKRASYEN